MATVVALPVMVVLVVIQTVFVSRLPLLYGSADIILLALIAWALQEKVKNAWAWALIGGTLVSVISALPSLTPLLGYLFATGIARLLEKRIWQTPILAMLLATLLGTVVYQGLSLVALRFAGTSIDIKQALNLVVLPSLLLNMILALPIHTIMVDLSQWLYPLEIKS